VQPSSDESICFNSSRSKTAKLGGMGENIYFIHRRVTVRGCWALPADRCDREQKERCEREWKRESKETMKTEYYVRYRARDREGFEMYILWGLNLGC